MGISSHFSPVFVQFSSTTFRHNPPQPTSFCHAHHFPIYLHFPPFTSISPHFPPFPPIFLHCPHSPPPLYETPKAWFGELVSSVAVSADAGT